VGLVDVNFQEAMLCTPYCSRYSSVACASCDGQPPAGPGYHTCGNIKGKKKNSQKGKREKGEKGNFLRFISIVIFPKIKIQKSFEKHVVHCITFT